MFTKMGLELLEDAEIVLPWLRNQGVQLGLISNCAPDVPQIWHQLPWSKQFQHSLFSCGAGIAKPSPEIYRMSLEALSVPPYEVLYVGDGSDNELTGAQNAGMDVIYISRDLSNTYDSKRRDVLDWAGPRIHDLRDIQSFIELLQVTPPP